MTNQQIYNAGADAFKSGSARTTNPWDANKAGASREAAGVWDRAWVDASKSLPKIDIGDVNIGDIAAEMHGHETNFGVFKGWMVSNMFEISEEMFNAMSEVLASHKGHKNPGNKFSRIVSINESYSDNSVRSVLVIYAYDFSYYAATLVMPS